MASDATDGHDAYGYGSGASPGPGSGDPDPDEVFEALRGNNATPYGRARTVRAEDLAEQARRTGRAKLHILALQELISAYNQGGERQKMLVPFATTLRMWDARPEDFDERAAHVLHWHFKWATGGMVADPKVPLAAIETWLAEMDRRYRLAGHSTRPVHQAEFELARHVGDRERASAAFDRWLAAERDSMSDCEACERNDQGRWRVDEGADAEALELWAPVLDGSLSCNSEPHDVLSLSLLPLVRLGELDRARASHLRGYRLARSAPDLRSSVGRHVEFCALTGNEGRGLELLTEHVRWFDTESIARSQLDFLAGCAVLLRRLLRAVGGDAVVSIEAGRTWTVEMLHDHAEQRIADLAGLFDERNGNDAESGRVRARLGRAPLVGSLLLGVPGPSAGAASVPAGPRTGTGGPGPAATGEDTSPVSGEDFPALLAEARRRSALGRPDAEAAWRRVAASVRAAGGRVDPVVAAELLEQRGRWSARTSPGETRRLFLDAAARFEAAGLPGRAIRNRARAALALVAPDHPARDVTAALEETMEAVHEVIPLVASGAADNADDMVTRLCRASVLLSTITSVEADGERPRRARRRDPDRADRSAVPATVDGEHGNAAVELLAEVHHVVSVAAADRDAMRLTEATELHARYLLATGEIDEAAALLRRIVDSARGAELPWLGAASAGILAELLLHAKAFDEADRVARDALDVEAHLVDPMIHGGLRLTLADACSKRERHDEAAGHALQAVHLFDRLDQVAPAAHARIVLAQIYHVAGRGAEAAAVFEETLPAFADFHGDGAFETARVRQELGFCLAAIGEYRAAAEQFLVAADAARQWPDQTSHAMLASDAARALAEAGLGEEAVRAFEQATELWLELGRIGPYVRSLRATAWQVYRDGADLDRALALMDRAAQALGELEPRRKQPPDLDRKFEIAETADQTARLLAEAAGDRADRATGEVDGDLAGRALEYALRAARGFVKCGESRWNDLVAARYLAARIEADMLGRAAAGARRLRGIVADCERRGDDLAAEWAARCRDALAEEAGS